MSKQTVDRGNRSGKTSLAKRWFADLYESGYVPIFLEGKSLRFVNDVQFDDALRAAFQNQYSAGSYEQYRQLSVSRRALIVDDFHNSKIRRDQFAAFLTVVERSFHHVIFVSHDFTQQLSELADARRVLEERPNFDQYQIEQFGHVRRDDLVQKWVALDPAFADRPTGPCATSNRCRTDNQRDNWAQLCSGLSGISTFHLAGP